MQSFQRELAEKGFAKVKPKKDKTKKNASLSRRELEELMGIKRDTYKRVNGAVRRK